MLIFVFNSFSQKVDFSNSNNNITILGDSNAIKVESLVSSYEAATNEAFKNISNSDRLKMVITKYELQSKSDDERYFFIKDIEFDKIKILVDTELLLYYDITQYDEIYPDFKSNLHIYKLRNEYGFLSNSASRVLSGYQSVQPFNSNEYTLVQIKKEYNIIDKMGNAIMGQDYVDLLGQTKPHVYGNTLKARCYLGLTFDFDLNQGSWSDESLIRELVSTKWYIFKTVLRKSDGLIFTDYTGNQHVWNSTNSSWQNEKLYHAMKSLLIDNDKIFLERFEIRDDPVYISKNSKSRYSYFFDAFVTSEEAILRNFSSIPVNDRWRHLVKIDSIVSLTSIFSRSIIHAFIDLDNPTNFIPIQSKRTQPIFQKGSDFIVISGLSKSGKEKQGLFLPTLDSIVLPRFDEITPMGDLTFITKTNGIGYQLKSFGKNNSERPLFEEMIWNSIDTCSNRSFVGKLAETEAETHGFALFTHLGQRLTEEFDRMNCPCEGMIRVATRKKHVYQYGFLNDEGILAIPTKYPEATDFLKEGYAPVGKLGKKKKKINKNGYYIK